MLGSKHDVSSVAGIAVYCAVFALPLEHTHVGLHTDSAVIVLVMLLCFELC